MSGHLPQVRTITATDGHPLTIGEFLPAGPPRGTVIISPAMGAAQSYYAAFAAWGAAQGWRVVTYDPRGIGASRTVPLRELDVDILGWARLDAAAVLAHAAAGAGEGPLVWVGHSLGAQIVPMVPGHERITQVVSVASGMGTWWRNAWPLRWRVPILWWLLVPVAVALTGYFPGRRLRAVGDLPRGVILQWRRWCLDADYAVGVEGAWLRAAYAAVRAPLTAITLADDEMMSPRNSADLHRLYTGAPQVHQAIHPRDVGLMRIGHFGFFRRTVGPVLWPRFVAPVLAQAGG